MNTDSTGSHPLPQARFFAAGGSPVSSRNASTGLLWLSMGQNGAGRKLGDSWVMTVTASSSDLGEDTIQVSYRIIIE